jgi:hypothetical protein
MRYGLILGVACAVNGVGCGALPTLTSVLGQGSVDGGVSLFGRVAFLAGLGLLIEAGNIATERTGQVVSGLIAGLLAGLLAGIGIAVSTIIFTMVSGGSPHIRSLVASIIGVLVAAACFGCAGASLGAGLGALGGLIGQARFRSRQARELAGQATHLPKLAAQCHRDEQ